MEKKISSSTSKSELLEAYKELLEKVQNQKVEEPRLAKEKEDKKETVKAASQLSSEIIIKGLAELKLNIGVSLDKLEESMIAEFRKFSQLQEAIETESRNLEELYQIKMNADTLAALLLAQKEKKFQLENEISRRKQEFEEERKEAEILWDKEKKDKENQIKEQDVLQKKLRQREEEEYVYNQKLQRKKEEDDYLQKKTAQEKELQESKIIFDKEILERETIISTREKDWAELTKKVESFPIELEKAVKQAEKAIQEKIESKYKFDAELMEKETAGENKLNKQLISGLEAKIKEQAQLIAQLTQKADYAADQVRDIAVKALESASNNRFSFKEKSEE